MNCDDRKWKIFKAHGNDAWIFNYINFLKKDSQFLDLQPKFDAMYSVIDHLNQTHVHYIALSHK